MKLYYEYSISRGKSEGQLQLRNYSANIVHSYVVCGKLWEERSNVYNRKQVCINNKHMLVVREKGTMYDESTCSKGYEQCIDTH